MQSEHFMPANGRCSRFVWEPGLAEVLRDPMIVALMAADRVDRRDLDVLFDRTRSSLRRRAG
jgi:hypothetical protein